MQIKSVKAREILSAGSYPTIETVVTVENDMSGKASVPFGSSAGTHESITLLDNDPKRYSGFGMLKAIEKVNNVIGPSIIGMDVSDQKAIDSKIISLDPTTRKEVLGGNSTLSVSLASARAASIAKGIPLYKHITEVFGFETKISKLPKPMMVLIEGGVHADNSTDFQEYLISINKNEKVAERVRMGIEVYHQLKAILKENNLDTNVGLEGAFAPTGILSNKDPLVYITEAIQRAGFIKRDDVGIAMDPASSEFFKDGKYDLQRENRKLTSDEMIIYYQELINNFPIVSLEDGLAEDDWAYWTKLNELEGRHIMIVGDDLTTTHTDRLQKAIDDKAINSIIIKPNQVGTLLETIEAIQLAKSSGFKTILSHRGGGESIDTFIIDIAASSNADFVKVGASRGERVEKYNRLMEIADELNL